VRSFVVRSFQVRLLAPPVDGFRPERSSSFARVEVPRRKSEKLDPTGDHKSLFVERSTTQPAQETTSPSLLTVWAARVGFLQDDV